MFKKLLKTFSKKFCSANNNNNNSNVKINIGEPFILKKPKLKKEEYEKEWEILYKEKNKEKRLIVESGLNENEKNEVKEIFEKIKQLKPEEREYYIYITQLESEKYSDVYSLDESILPPDYLYEAENFWPKENPNWIRTDHMKTSMDAFLRSNEVWDNGKNQIQIQEDVTEKEEVKEVEKNKEKEVVPEKTEFTVRLISFEPTKKIAIIKEVKNLLQLSVKEVNYYYLT